MTLLIDQDGATVTNGTTLEDAPAVRISGRDVRFANAAGGTLRSTAAGVAALVIEGENAQISNAAGGSIQAHGVDDLAILGSAFGDAVENSGAIVGRVSLGDGNDRFTMLGDGYVQGSSPAIDLGSGDDVYVHSANGALATVVGGEGTDTLSLTHVNNILSGTNATGFERLTVANDPGRTYNLENFSGYQIVEVGAGGSYNFIYSVDPNAAVTVGAGANMIAGVGSTFASVTGSSSGETVEVSSATVTGNVSLGGGDDVFWYTWFEANQAAPIVHGTIDGGTGNDIFLLWIHSGHTVDLANVTGFETLNGGTWAGDDSNVRVINASGFTSIMPDTTGGVLTLAQSNLSAATLTFSYGGTAILEATATIKQVGEYSAALALATEGANWPGVTLVNGGTILGNVYLGTTNDTYDATSGGTVGGSGGVFGYAGNDVLKGGSGADRFSGGYGADQLFGNGGDDQLDGEAGNDFLSSGAGIDSLSGGTGDDVLYFGASLGQSDAVSGGAGSDMLVLQGAYGSGMFFEQPTTLPAAQFNGIETLRLLSGADTSFGDQSGGTYNYAFAVTDAAVAAGATLTVDFLGLRNGNTQNYETAKFDGSAETDGRFVFLAGGFRTDLKGGAGNDRFDYAVDAPSQGSADGGAGYDEIVYRGGMFSLQMSNIEKVTFQTGYSDPSTPYFMYLSVMNGDGAPLTVDARGLAAGEDMVIRTYDYISNVPIIALVGGGRGFVETASRDDTIYFGATYDSRDWVNAGEGSDRVILQGSYDLTIGQYMMVGVETLSLLSAGDSSFGGASAGPNHYNLTLSDEVVAAGGRLTVDASGLSAAEALVLHAESELDGSIAVTGGAAADSLFGGAGGDLLDGGAGADTMKGGAGNDVYGIDQVGDVVTELAGEGTDTIRTALGTQAAIYALAANVENLIGTSATGQTVAGNALDNVMTMGVGNDVLDLSAGGTDTANGGGGNDYVYFGAAFTAADTIIGGTGTDTVGLLGNYNLTLGANSLFGVENLSLLSGTAAGGTAHVTYSITTVDENVQAGGRLTVYGGGLLADESLFFNGYAETDGALSVYGGAGNDTFAGGPANDAFVGGAGDDTMYGLGGKDWLEGGLGADTMRGGPGNDVFVYQSAAESTAAKTDHILDFEYVSDHIVLTNIDANTNAAGDQAFTFIGGNAFSNTAGELRAYQSGASWFVEGDVNGDGVADLVIQVDPVAGHAIIASDFLL